MGECELKESEREHTTELCVCIARGRRLSLKVEINQISSPLVPPLSTTH